jgi:hypothetical protein
MKALFEIFYQPGKLFESLPERKGVWVAPMIAVALLVLIVSILVPHFIGRENVARQQLENFSGRMSPEQLQAMFPYWLVSAAMTALILIGSPDPTSLDVKNLIATNVAAYMDKNSMARGLYSLLSSIDILSFGEIGLLAFGFSKIARTNLFFGFAAVGGLWILYVSAKMVLSLLF